MVNSSESQVFDSSLESKYVVIFFTSKGDNRFSVKSCNSESEKDEIVEWCYERGYKYFVCEKRYKKANEIVYVLEKVGYYKKVFYSVLLMEFFILVLFLSVIYLLIKK